jgi:hypothetical protein
MCTSQQISTQDVHDILSSRGVFESYCHFQDLNLNSPLRVQIMSLTVNLLSTWVPGLEPWTTSLTLRYIAEGTDARFRVHVTVSSSLLALTVFSVIEWRIVWESSGSTERLVSDSPARMSLLDSLRTHLVAFFMSLNSLQTHLFVPLMSMSWLDSVTCISLTFSNTDISGLHVDFWEVST